MKKILSLVLVLAMMLLTLAACGNDIEALNKAKDYLYSMYKDQNGSITPVDFERVGIVTVDGVQYTIEWTTNNDKIKVTPNGNIVTIDVDEQSATDEAYTLTATVKDAKGNTASCSFDHAVPKYNLLTIAEVLTKNVGDAVLVSGTVSAIETAWDTGYKNMTVVIKDSTGATLRIYRLDTKVELGDIITVNGVVEEYNSKKQIADGATAVITGKETITYTQMTITEALAAAEGTNVKISGIVCEIKSAWSSSYKNMEVYIRDDAGNKILLYRTGTEVALGDTVTVQGAIGSYNNVNQIAQGSTATIDVDHSAVGCSYPTEGLVDKCSICGVVKADHAEHTDADDNNFCDTCGNELVIPTYTCAEANALAVDTKATVSGVVTSISGKNIIITDATGTFQFYNLTNAADIGLGDTITVVGAISEYSNTKQISAVAATINVDHSETPGACQYPTTGLTAVCTICGGIDPTHTTCVDAEPNNYCDACGERMAIPGQVSATYVVADAAATGGWTNGNKPSSAPDFAIDSVITMTVSGGSNTGKYYTTGGIRVYQNETPSIVISATAGYTIAYVEITYTVDKTGVLTQGSTQIASGEIVDVNATSITFGVGNTGTATNGQVRISAVTVVYVPAT